MIHQPPAKENVGKLVELFQESNSRHKYRSIVLVIPDFETATAASWQDGWNNCWLQTRLPAMLCDPRVLSFEPGLSCSDDFSWRYVLEWGDVLLQQLLQESENDAEFNEKPLFFIAHGLGGLVLKRALGVLFERFFESKYQRLIRSTAGVILLGCPHPNLNRPRDLDAINLIVKATRKQSTKATKASERTGELMMVIANICQKFNDVGIESPVLSVYETKLSKLRRNIFSPRQLLVDRHLCETLLRRERLLGAECSHDELCNVSSRKPQSTLDNELVQFFGLALDLKKAYSGPSFSRHGSSSVWTSQLTDIGDIPARMNRPSLNESLPTAGLATDGSSEDGFIHIPLQSNISLETFHPKARLPCYLYGGHERNPDFIGREEVLHMLDEALLHPGEFKGASLMKTFALCGIGGLGKSEIATEWAHARRNEFDAVFWIHAGDNERLASDFAQIAVSLRLVDREQSGDQVVLRSLVLQFLATSAEKQHRGSNQDLPVLTPKWLLIFDNAESLSDLRDYWPVSGNGSVLITSRDPLARTQTYFHSPNGIDLEPFSAEESASWLRKLTRHNTIEDVELSELIVEKLSNLPLAIRRVAGVILRQDLSLREFLSFSTKKHFELAYMALNMV